ncbi:MAG: LON peptidase substrate-binding domain-containing protein [Pseudomonadales bacterium]|jgi:Lon protease-like protein|nr:LON peptidase substrate-binding domain-containing protein [Pseudomonadales bacterium]
MQGTGTIALFPLNAVIFPRGRISLQIFESRYVDLIRECLRNDSGFGIVLIESGSEVAARGDEKLDVHRTGTYCKVVDWNQLPSGLLGITVEGQGTFRVLQTWREANQLCRAVVSFRPQDSVAADAMEVGEAFAEYVELLRGLAQHPAVEELRLHLNFDNLREIAWRLSELLPIGNREKQLLLDLVDPIARLEQIELFVSAMHK